MNNATFPRVAFLALLLAAFVGSASGAEQKNERRIIPLGLHGEPAAPTSFAAFGGQSVTVDLHIPADIDRTKIIVKVFQLSQKIAVRLKDDTTLDKLLDSGTDILRVQMPDVKSITSLLFSFHNPSKDQKTATRLGDLRFRVYPNIPLREKARPLADAIRQYQTNNPTSLPAILLVGDTETLAPLRAFLAACDIPFEDGHNSLDVDAPSASVLHLGYLPANSTRDTFPAFGEGHWLLFAAAIAPELFPGVYSTTTPGGVFTKVTLPLLPRLATDPQAQETMLHLITEAVRPVLAVDVSK
ncbi:hypothetical protein Ga0100231_022670 [Opitutaceae bacterium TAV4]|nr:hypothetical protein Ga0100231_022670 [Opitutaceae bacterium TAV4]RRK00659.1 hypothetical protein Ga0100230_022910 [Opitutaceae bacterium TAV3]